MIGPLSKVLRYLSLKLFQCSPSKSNFISFSNFIYPKIWMFDNEFNISWWLMLKNPLRVTFIRQWISPRRPWKEDIMTRWPSICQLHAPLTCFWVDFNLATLVDLWWQNFGNDVLELKRFSIQILSHTYNASGCGCNWSMFEKMHVNKHNQLSY